MRRSVRLLLLGLIALLPLRGVALTLMAFDVLPPAAMQPVSAETAAASPCHDSHDADGVPADSAPGHHGCSLCGLCHSAVAPTVEAPAPSAHASPTTPAAASPGGNAQRQPGPPDRPPRA